SVIGPYGASDVGRLKMPTPMTEPMIRAIASGKPNFPDDSRVSAAGAAGALNSSVTPPSFSRSGASLGKGCGRTQDGVSVGLRVIGEDAHLGLVAPVRPSFGEGHVDTEHPAPVLGGHVLCRERVGRVAVREPELSACTPRARSPV